MHDHVAEDHRIPRFVLRAAMALVLFAFAAVAIGRYTDTGLTLTPPAAPVEARELRFETQADTSVVISDVQTGRMVALLKPDGDGFIRGVLRGLARGAALERIDERNVYVVTRWDDGRLSISDPATGARFDLNSFGRTNLDAVARLLKSREGTQ
jgi:putative photosynthetic complex assembly protein